MCHPRRGSRHGHAARCTCGCCSCGCAGSFRRFYSSQEELECLEAYRDELVKELAGVDERLSELKGK